MKSMQLMLLGLALICSSCDQSSSNPENSDRSNIQVAAAESVPSEEATPPENESRAPAAAKTDSALVLFKKRILPIFQASNPSSCSECHLSGVDLKDYILPTQEATFASLVSAGLIDVEKPRNSKLLTFIKRSPEKTELISQKVRQQEYDAFEAWILAAVREPELLADTEKGQPIGPQLPVEVIRHSRQDRVLASFVENIWTEIGRCAACHSPDQNQKQVAEHGERVSWITLNDPQATLDHMLENDLINEYEPEKSLLLLKPTMQVKHGGGQKAVVGDRTYKQFRRFIDDYSASIKGEYTSADELPAESPDVSVVTDIWMKVENVPAKYDKQLLQVDLYRKTDSGWTTARVATSDRPVFGPNNLWQHSLSLTAPRGSEAAKRISSKKLPPGTYLAKLYVDRTGKLEQDYKAELNDDDFVGEVEFESRWPAGYGKMTVIQYPAK